MELGRVTPRLLMVSAGLAIASAAVMDNAPAPALAAPADVLTLAGMLTAAERDWGYAKDYVEGMWMMLQQDEPDDYVVGTGEANSVGRLVELAFDHLGLDPAQELERRQADVARQAPHDLEGLLASERALEDVLGVRDATLDDEVLRLRDRPELLEDDLLLLGGHVVERGDLEHELVDLLGPEELEHLGGQLGAERKREDRGLATGRDVTDLGAGLLEQAR